MRRISSNSESGAILAIVIILMLALTITGIAFLNAGVMENRLVAREVHKNKAFYIAEGGLERTVWNLKQDFESGNRDWTDDINGLPVVDLPPGDPDYPDGWRLLDYDEASLSLGDGVYLVKVKYVDKDEIWVKSTGTVKGVPRTVQVLVEMVNLSAWNNAIFAGRGSVEGVVIEGNARIYGSVHILGENPDDPNDHLGPFDLAMDLSGAAGIRNNYEDLPPELQLTIPKGQPGETYTLDAELRVKYGQVGLSGTATVGEVEAGDSFKETMDGVYIGLDPEAIRYGGNQGAVNVYSDEEGTYDLGDKVKFPKLDDPYLNSEGIAYEYPSGTPLTYFDYLELCWEEISEDEISPDGEFFHFSNHPDPLTGGVGVVESSIDWDWYEEEGEGILEVKGVVWVNAMSLELGKNVKHNERIEYKGNGIIVVGEFVDGEFMLGDIRVVADLVAQGSPDTGEGFPKNVLGLIGSNIYLAPDPCDSQLTMTGAFYAEEKIVSRKQNEIAGTFVCKEFNIADQVPRIYQVPELATNVPKGMPGAPPQWSLTFSQWSES